MPRASNELAALIADIQTRIANAIELAQQEGRADALSEIRSLVGGGAPAMPLKRGPGRPKGSKNKPAAVTKSGKTRKNPWAGLSAAERLARVNAIRKGKGLPPKSE